MKRNNSKDGAPLPDEGSPDKNTSRSEQWSRFLKNAQVQRVKQISAQYLCYFLSTLAHPYRAMKSSQSKQMLHTAITLGLVVVLSAFYCFTWFCKLGLRSPFSLGFLKPLLLTALGLAVAYGLSYAVLRIEKVAIDPKLLMSRFASLLVPAVVALLLAIVLLLTGTFLFSSLFLFVAYLFVFVSINVLMLQYPLNTESGLIDSFYLIVAANAITGYVFYKLISTIIFGAMGGFGIF